MELQVLDAEVVVEVGLEAREIECAVLGNDDPEADRIADRVIRRIGQLSEGQYPTADRRVEEAGRIRRSPSSVVPPVGRDGGAADAETERITTEEAASLEHELSSLRQAKTFDIEPEEGPDDDFRFDWTSPIAASGASSARPGIDPALTLIPRDSSSLRRVPP